jgi:hypothetical protein
VEAVLLLLEASELIELCKCFLYQAFYLPMELRLFFFCIKLATCFALRNFAVLRVQLSFYKHVDIFEQLDNTRD